MQSNHIKPEVNYREFRIHKLNTPEFSHVRLLLYWPIFGLLFLFLERLQPQRNYYPVYCGLDDIIPFCEWALIPYLFWFVFLIGTLVYTFFVDVPAFRRMMYFVIVTSAILARRWTEINDTKQLTAINWETETLQTNEVALLSGDCTAWNKEPMLLNTLTTLMQKGEQNIVLQTPYMICNQAMYNALKKVTDNVQVQVITNAPQSGANPWGCADYLNHRDDILETGVDICEWNGSFSMHTKTILIDDRISIIGSFNWDMRSAYLDTEMMLLIDCPALNAILRDEAQQMMYEGKTISPDGVTVTGELYITPKVSATKQVLQSLLRIIVRPFRYVL